MDLRPLHRRQALRLSSLFALRLSAGLGVGGRPLVPRRDGGALGGSLPSTLTSGFVLLAHDDGWTLSYAAWPNVGRFHRGDGRGSPARPIVGLTQSEAAHLRHEQRTEIVRQANRGVT